MKKILLLLLLCLINIIAIAQTVPQEGTVITNAIPPSADAASLGKYGSLPVGTYTGVPNISIPLYTIKSGDLTLPVSISYHAGGNKVEEMASSVGLGWVLNAGGAIVRTVRGLPDEMNNGMLNAPYNIVLADSLSNLITTTPGTTAQLATLNLTLNHIADGTYDGESDIYNFNFGNYSGKFVMDSYGNVYVLPQQKIKFTFKLKSASNYIQSFTAETPDGVTYIFGSDADGNDAVEFTRTTNPNSAATSKQNIATSWFIKRIISPTGHQINFNYNQEAYGNIQPVSMSAYQFDHVVSGTGAGPGNSGSTTSYFSDNTFNTVILSSINFENGSLSIADTTKRLDVVGAMAINAIQINNFSNPAFNQVYNLYYANSSTSRLRLDSLIGLMGAVNPNKQKYSFVYNADAFNSSNANMLFAQDYWGYYNGQLGNVTLVPAMTWGGSPLTGANRWSDETSMLGGMLTQIIYPTGGYTRFTYEANREAAVSFGGTSSASAPVAQSIAFGNNPATSAAYNYDNANGNPNNNFTVFSTTGTTLINVSQIGLPDGSFGTVSNPTPTSAIANAYIYTSTDSVVATINGLHADTPIYLPNGNYHMGVVAIKGTLYTPQNTTGISYFVSAGWSNQNPNLVNNYVVGGLRIKQIADYDGVSSTPVNLKTYQYTASGSSASSGYLNGVPSFNYSLNIASNAGTTAYFVRTGVSNIPLGTSQGSVVAYNHVQEFIGSTGQNGMNEYFYNIFPDQTNSAFPFPPAINLEWKRGLLQKEVNYKQTGTGTYSMVHQKVNLYSSSNPVNIASIKAGFNPTPGLYSASQNYFAGPPVTNGGGQGQYINYYNYTDFTYLTSDTTWVYNESNPANYVKTYNSYTYDPGSFQLSKLTSVDSKNETIIQNVTYPGNYIISGTPTSSALLGILNLQNMNMLNVPVEEFTQKQNAGGVGLRTIKAVLSTYKPNLPVRDSVFEAMSVIPITTFTPSSVGTNRLVKDPTYQPVVSFNSYDTFGNILQESRVNGPLTSYIWGYLTSNTPIYNTYSIAKVINAASTDIAYTNFESYNTGGYGNWTYSNSGTTADPTAPMGANCYLVTGNTISKSGLNTALSYVVSFWAKTGAAMSLSGGTLTANPVGTTLNGWTYYEYLVTGASTISVGGNGYIDELRLYPVNAQMSTYTYSPLMGISAVCNPRSQFSYYQYDNVGRLTTVTDQNGNITKALTYHFQGQ